MTLPPSPRLAPVGAELVSAVPAASSEPPSLETARALERAGRWRDAREAYRALMAEGAREEKVTDAALLRWIGTTLRAEGRAGEALESYRASLSAAAAAGHVTDQAHALNWMGILYQERGRLEIADRLFRRARRLAAGVGEDRVVAMVDQNLGINANIRGELSQALRHYRRSLSRYQQHGDEESAAKVLNDLGMLFTDLRAWRSAEIAFRRSAGLCRRHAELHTLAMVEVNRTELLLLQGKLEGAREVCNGAYRLAHRTGHTRAIGEVHKWYGVIYRQMGKPDVAEAHLEQAYRLATRTVDPLLAAEAQRELGQLYAGLDRNREALEALSRARRMFEKVQARRDAADVGRRSAELEAIFLAVVRRWGDSIESKDPYTAGHCERVAQYAVRLARELGFSAEDLKWFWVGALLHDVGKIVVPREVLNKPGALDARELELMRGHAAKGAEIVDGLDLPFDIQPMVRGHHERWDGTGYPDGLRESEIPLSARILCVADVFDALTTARPYRTGFTVEEALTIMAGEAGRTFDPEIFPRFRALVLRGFEGEGRPDDAAAEITFPRRAPRRAARAPRRESRAKLRSDPPTTDAA